jgi:hypothetical protein
MNRTLFSLAAVAAFLVATPSMCQAQCANGKCQSPQSFKGSVRFAIPQYFTLTPAAPQPAKVYVLPSPVAAFPVVAIPVESRRTGPIRRFLGIGRR